MMPETINALVNLGSAGAVIIVVYYFLRHEEKRDRQYQEREVQWQIFFKGLMDNQQEPMTKLIQAIERLLEEFQTHDTWEHTKLDEMTTQINRKTSLRKP